MNKSANNRSITAHTRDGLGFSKYPDLPELTSFLINLHACRTWTFPRLQSLKSLPCRPGMPNGYFAFLSLCGYRDQRGALRARLQVEQGKSMPVHSDSRASSSTSALTAGLHKSLQSLWAKSMLQQHQPCRDKNSQPLATPP